MALAFGQGSEETAPLGRAVIGGLFAATLATCSCYRPYLASFKGVHPSRRHPSILKTLIARLHRSRRTHNEKPLSLP